MGRLRKLALAVGFVFAAASSFAIGTCYMKKQAARMHQKSCDSRITRIKEENRKSKRKLESALKAQKTAQLYLRSLGIDRPKEKDYGRVSEIFKLRIIRNHMSNGKLPKSGQLKGLIENNYLTVNGAGGLLLSSDGYFITANHVVEGDPKKVRVRHGSKTTTAGCFCWTKPLDAALCKMDVDKEFKVAELRFAPLSKLRRGMLVEVLGQVKGKLYHQVGRILNTDYSSFVGDRRSNGSMFYSALLTTAYAEPGFSGGPVFLRDTGELIGFLSYTAADNSFSGVARIDHFLRLLGECAKLKIKQIQKEQQSGSKKEK